MTQDIILCASDTQYIISNIISERQKEAAYSWRSLHFSKTQVEVSNNKKTLSVPSTEQQ